MKTINTLALTFVLILAGMAYASADTQATHNHAQAAAQAACCKFGSACCKHGASCCAATCNDQAGVKQDDNQTTAKACCKSGTEQAAQNASCCKFGSACCKHGASCCAAKREDKTVAKGCCKPDGQKSKAGCRAKESDKAKAAGE